MTSGGRKRINGRRERRNARQVVLGRGLADPLAAEFSGAPNAIRHRVSFFQHSYTKYESTYLPVWIRG